MLTYLGNKFKGVKGLRNRQEQTPIFEAVKKYYAENTVPFHVPAHKLGRGIPEFKAYVGENVLSMDLTCFAGTDNICNPCDVIAEAEALAADAYGADKAFF